MVTLCSALAGHAAFSITNPNRIRALVGAFAVRGNPADVIMAVAAGIFGLLLRLIRIPMAPIVIGMALGATFEQSLRQGLMLTDGSFLAFFQQPIALVVLLLTALVIGWPFLRAAFRR